MEEFEIESCCPNCKNYIFFELNLSDFWFEDGFAMYMDYCPFCHHILGVQFPEKDINKTEILLEIEK